MQNVPISELLTLIVGSEQSNLLSMVFIQLIWAFLEIVGLPSDISIAMYQPTLPGKLANRNVANVGAMMPSGCHVLA